MRNGGVTERGPERYRSSRGSLPLLWEKASYANAFVRKKPRKGYEVKRKGSMKEVQVQTWADAVVVLPFLLLLP